MIVIFYPAAVLLLSVGGYLMKKMGSKADNIDSEIMRCRQIDGKTDRLKELLFNLSVALIFFIAAPFAVFYFILQA